jgi:predicted dehydrogenase
MSAIRAGVAGVGHLGYHHARIYHAAEDVELVGVADPDAKRRARAEADFDTAGYATLDELLTTGIDVLSIASPTVFHHDLARQAMDAGVDVLVEKPLAANLDQARALAAKAAETGRILQVGHIERFNGAVTALMSALKNPRFIECHRLSPYPNRGDDVSVILDLMIHDLDIVRALDGTDVVSVDAAGVSVFSDHYDIANARIRFASGCVANVTCSRVSVDRMRKIRVFSEDAYASTDYSEQQVMVYRKKPGKLEPGASPMEMISIDPLPVVRDEPLKRELEAFIECARNRTRPLVSGEDGVAAMELAEQVERSIREWAP